MKLKIICSKPELMPKYETEGASGLDLHLDLESTSRDPQSGKGCAAGRDYVSLHNSIEGLRLWTGIRVEVPSGYELQVRPRSGLTSKGLIVHLGTIDSDYRGEIVVLVNVRDQMSFHHGDRIAQAVICPVKRVELAVVNELSPSARGEKGFGSTGV